MISSNDLFKKKHNHKIHELVLYMLHATPCIFLQRHCVYFTKPSATVHFSWCTELEKKIDDCLDF